MNRALTATDLAELERMMVESGVGERDQIDKAASEANGLGLFIRSLVGLDRGAAKEAFNTFLPDRALSANQIEFVNLIVNHLTEHGVMDPAYLCDSPFTDLTPQGPDGLFNSAQVDRLVEALTSVKARAVALSNGGKPALYPRTKNLRDAILQQLTSDSLAHVPK
jgi:type I restriction enzyme R subunit